VKIISIFAVPIKKATSYKNKGVCNVALTSLRQWI